MERPTEGLTGRRGRRGGEAPPAARRAAEPDLAGARVGGGAGSGLWRAGAGPPGRPRSSDPRVAAPPHPRPGRGRLPSADRGSGGHRRRSLHFLGARVRIIPPREQLRAGLQKPHLRPGAGAGGGRFLFLFFSSGTFKLLASSGLIRDLTLKSQVRGQSTGSDAGRDSL